MIWAALFLVFCAAPVTAETILRAEYDQPTGRYAHGILGDAVEWGALRVVTDGGNASAGPHQEKSYLIQLPPQRVFEDTMPRLADVDGDGSPEIIVVETHVATGAQLAVYDETGKLAATPHIGQTHRWLAPVGVADLDGDGAIELAYIDRPHLLKTLRVWRYRDGALIPVADLAGLTNHRIGDVFISGGLRDCGAGPEMITASADWARVMATVLQDGVLLARDLGAYRGPESLRAAVACDTQSN